MATGARPPLVRSGRAGIRGRTANSAEDDRRTTLTFLRRHSPTNAWLAGLGGGILVGSVVFVLERLDVSRFDLLVALVILIAVLAAVAGGIADRLRRSRTERQLVGDKLRAVRDAGSEAVVGIALDGTITSWSSGAAETYGFEEDEAVGHPFFTLVSDAAPETAGKLLDRLQEGEGIDGGERVQKRGDGTDVTVALTIAPVFGPDGEVVAGFALACDVGERARLKHDLRDAEWRYRALVDQLPLVTYLRQADEEGKLLYISRQIESTCGYSPDECLAEPELFARLLHPDDRERVLSEDADTPDSLAREYRIYARDGRVVWLREERTTVRDPSGRPLYRQGSLVDISARKALDAERDRLQAAEQAAFARANEASHRLELLAEASTMLGSSLRSEKALRKVAELVVRHLADWCLFHVFDNEGELEPLAVAHAEPTAASSVRADKPESAWKAVASRVISTRRSEHGHGVEPFSDNGRGEASTSVPTCESYVCVPLIARNRALGALTLVSTSSGRTFADDDVAIAEELARRAADALDTARLYREVEERADAARVLTYVADGVFLLDRTGVIKLWNPAAEAITGLSEGSVTGRAAADVIPAWDSVADRIPVSLSPEPGPAATVPLDTPRGERWISIAGVDFFGGTVYAFRDFTEERRLEELKAEFVATASHELRTPLAAVYGAAQTLRRHDFALDEAGRERFVSLIADESERLSRIVNEILLANQLEAGRLDVALDAFDPNDLVERVVESARVHVPPGMAIEIVPQDSVSPVLADRDKVRQVLINLIENAIKYSPDGGAVEVALEQKDDALRFSVKDEGLGIPEEEQARIFDKFYRLDPDLTRGVGGTGLGLYICNELVDRMGGRIWVDSAEGEGSTFSFELPVAEAALARPQRTVA